MDKLQMAKALLSETKYSNPGQTTTAYGVAVTDSQDGLVSVDMGGDTVSFDDEQAIECETTFKVYEGDEVIVSLIGADGSGKTPIIIGVVGRGDEQQTEIDGVKNYFWTNDRGAHISTVEQSVEGANMLLDADSLDIRIGGSNSEEDQTTVAKFGRDTAYISGVDGTRYWQIRDLRDVATKVAKIEDYRIADGITFVIKTDFIFTDIINVMLYPHNPHPAYLNRYDEPYSNESSGYYVDVDNHEVIIWRYYRGEYVPLDEGTAFSIVYFTSENIFSYTEGTRKYNSKIAPFSKTTGYNNIASGNYSIAHGYLTEATGIASSAEGYNTKAYGNYQKVFGKNNIEDLSDQYALIVGNGEFTSEKRTESFTTDGVTTQFQLNGSPSAILEAKLHGSIEYTDHVEQIIYDYMDGSFNVGNRGWHVYIYLDTAVEEDTVLKIVDSENTMQPGYSIEESTLSYDVTIQKDSNHCSKNIGSVNPIINSLEPTDYLASLEINENADYSIVGLITDGCIELNKRFSISGLTLDIVYNSGQLKDNNALTLDWNGNVELEGALFLGGCVANDESPFSAVRYNTEDDQGEYYDNTFNDSKWVPINGIGSLATTVKSLYSGLLISDTTNKEIFLPQGSVCLLITQEFNSSTNAYRGHRAVLLSVPKGIIYPSTAVQQVNLGASTNSGVTITRPSYGAIQLKCSSTTYSVNYQIILLTPGLQYPYKLPIIVNGLITKRFSNTSFIDQIRSSGSLINPCDCGRCNLDVTEPFPSVGWITRNMFMRKIDLTDYSTCHVELRASIDSTGDNAGIEIGFFNNGSFEASQSITLTTRMTPYMIDIDVTALEGEYYLAIDSINDRVAGQRKRSVDLFEIGLL